MAASFRFENPVPQHVDGNGSPRANGTYTFYEPGTTTPKNTYPTQADAEAGTNANANPITLDSEGSSPVEIWLVGDYRWILKNSAGATVRDRDPLTRSAVTTPLNVATVATLRALAKPAEQVSMITGGYAALGDGGGGVWSWDAASTDTDNGATVVNPTGNGGAGRWIRVIQGFINIRWFGATGDGVTDDTTAFQAATTFCYENGYTLFFPVGIYKVTEGVTTTAAWKEYRWLGDGDYLTGFTGVAKASIILFAPAVGTDSLLYQTLGGRHSFENMVFVGSEPGSGGEMKMFRFDAANSIHRFHNVTFDADFAVADTLWTTFPIYYEEDCYFQNSSFTNVSFRGTGTFGSASNNLKGTLLSFNNVNKEASTPPIPNKIVCDLSGIRSIVGYNFLLEGSTSSAGWTALKIDVSGYAADWIRNPTAEFHGFHVEFTGSGVDYALHTIGSRVAISSPSGGISVSYPMRLDDFGEIVLRGVTFSGTADIIDDYFQFDDLQSFVHLDNCSGRSMVSANKQITMTNCHHNSSTDDSGSGVVINNHGSHLCWEFDGGIPPNNFSGVTVDTASGGTITNSTDSTYGRKLVVTPSGNTARLRVRAPLQTLVELDQMHVVLAVKLPTFTGGNFRLQQLFDVTAQGDFVVLWDSTFSNTLVTVCATRSLHGIGAATTVGFLLTDLSATGVSGTMEVYVAQLWVGGAQPRLAYKAYPNNVISWAGAAPTTGTWKDGDVTLHTAPATGAPDRWVCTTAGTPGTWTATANL